MLRICCVYLHPMFSFPGPCEKFLQVHTTACSVIYCCRALQRVSHSFCFQAFLKVAEWNMTYCTLCVTHSVPLPPHPTKYNPRQSSSARHPLNISLFFDKDWTSWSFVTVTVTGRLISTLLQGDRCNLTSCDCAGRESIQRVVCACLCGVSVCVRAATLKSRLGKANGKKSSKCVFSSDGNVQPKDGRFQVNFMDY